MTKRRFHVASDEDIRQGLTTDVYFMRTEEALRGRGVDKYVVGEVRTKHLPESWQWAVLTGMEEVAHLLEGLNLKVWAMPEGTLFRAGEPVLTIEGSYTDFGRLETAFLGLLCQATGVATRAARCRVLAEDRPVLSFGARRMHPALAPMIDRAAYIGGCDGVSTYLTSVRHEIPASGTMPHALILVLGDTLEAARAFDEAVDPEIPRIVLIDTLLDEKFEALRVAEGLGKKLAGIRLDTPSSRRGNLKELMQEVRWELDLRGYQHVKLFASGGLDEHSIPELNAICDGYGVGTTFSNAPTVNFGFDLVEIEGVPFAKRGKESGAKWVTRCVQCGERQVIYWKQDPGPCSCGGQREILNQLLLDGGRIVSDLPAASVLRERVLDQLKGITL